MKSTIRLKHYKKDLMRGFETDARADKKQMTFFWPNNQASHVKWSELRLTPRPDPNPLPGTDTAFGI